MQDDTSRKILWFTAGFAAGAVIGLLTAPQSGAELYERGKHVAEEAADLFEEGRRLMDRADAAGQRS